MKKTWAILMGVVLGVVAVIALASATTTAQEPTPAQDATQPPMQQNGNGSGWNGRGPGMGMDDRGDCAPNGKPMGDMGRDAHLTVLAEALGMTTDEVIAALQDGNSVADIADEQGVAIDTVVDALVAQAEERIATAVEEDRLTQDEADSKLEAIREQITTRINETHMPGDRPGFAPNGGRGRGGPMHALGHGPIEDVAEALNMTTDEVIAALQDGNSVADIADEQGIAVDTVVDTLVTKAEGHLATLVEDGRLTQDEADSKLEAIREEITTRINETHMPGDRPGFAPNGGRGRGGPMHALGHGPIEDVAEALNMTTDEVIAALQDGNSVADIADEQGIAVDTVVDTLVTKAEGHLATLVEDGRLTQDEADSKLETIREEITTRINETHTPRGPGMRF